MVNKSDFGRFALKRAYSKLYVTNFIETINFGLLSIIPRIFWHIKI